MLRIFTKILCFLALISVTPPIRAQTSDEQNAVSILLPFSTLYSSTEGQHALTVNLETTLFIQNHATSAEQIQAMHDDIRDTKYGTTLADGLGVDFQNAYFAAIYADDPKTQNVRQMFTQALKVATDNANFGKSFFGNGTFEDAAAIGPALPVNGQYNVYGDAYLGGSLGPSGLGNPRPFQVKNPSDFVYFEAPTFVSPVPGGSFSQNPGPPESNQHVMVGEADSPSFPSGHSTYGAATGILYAMMVPELYQQMMARSLDFGYSRLVMGVHYTTDVMGGRILGTYSAVEWLSNPAHLALFQQATEDFREILAAGAGTSDLAAAIASQGGVWSQSEVNEARGEYLYRMTYDLPGVSSTTLDPVVSAGAEILLSTRFPYLDDAQRKEVLYTTEIASGAALDDGSGWARLNLFDAAGGYGELRADTVVFMDAALGGFNAQDTWNNDIDGTGHLIKEGTGHLILSGDNSFAGVSVAEGTLDLLGPTDFSANSSVGGSGVASKLGVKEFMRGTSLEVGSGGDLELGTLDFSSARITLSGDFTVSSDAHSLILEEILNPGMYQLVAFGGTGTNVTNFSLSFGGTADFISGVELIDTGSALSFEISRDAVATGSRISGISPFLTFLPNSATVDVADGAQIGSLVVDTTSRVVGGQLLVDRIDTRGHDVVLDNSSVLAPSGFSKAGAGMLKILNNVFVNGDMKVERGTLVVNGLLTSNLVIVDRGAWLKGIGRIVGSLRNSGFFAPGNSPGTIELSGDFVQTPGGSMQEEIASLGDFDRVVIGGTASLAGNLNIVPFGGFHLEYGQQFAGFIQAAEINGEFDSITAPDGFRGRVLQNGGTLTLLIAPESYTQVAQNENQRNVAGALDAFIGASGDRDVVSTALDLQNEDQYGNAFDQIMPGFYSSLVQMSLEQMTAQNQFVAQRLSAVRLGANGFNAQGLNMPLANDRDGKSVLEAKDAKTVIAPANATKWSLWVQGNGIFGRMTLTNLPTNRYASGGFLGGVDYRWNENFTSGIYSGYQGTYSKYSNGSSTTINSTLFGLYATYQEGGFYGDAIIGGAYNNYGNRRSIEFSTIDRTGRSDVNGGQVGAYLDAGYDFTAGKFTFGPLASFQYTYTGLGGFAETGADSLDLAVDQYNANSIRTNLGGRIAYAWNVTDRVIITPELRMFWQHEYLNDQQSMSASLDGGTGPGFSYQPSAIGQDSVFAGAGASVQVGPNWNAYFYYNADFGRQDYVGQMISMGLNWKF